MSAASHTPADEAWPREGFLPSSAQVEGGLQAWFPAFERAALAHGVDADWLPTLAGLGPELGIVGDALARRSAAGERILPAAPLVLRALSIPAEQVRVLIVGQDPYPTPGHGIGLSFAVERTVSPLPRSLANIFKELTQDLGCERPSHGDLSAWKRQGVMLLNRSLTVTAGEPGSHAKDGWAPITEAVVRRLGAKAGPPVAILWGAHAQKLAPLLQGHPIIASAHPSPLSASRGFFGSRPFSRANDALRALGIEPVNWGAKGEPPPA